MSTYVLLHGGKKTGDIWAQVASLLRASHNIVYCPTLSDARGSTLEDHIAEVCHVIKDQHEIILVGHSYAGLVITGVANRFSEKIAQLIYVDAAVPESGQSLFDIFKANGFDAERDYGIEPLRPFTDPLIFDEALLKKIKKSYLLCTSSEFIQISKPLYDKITKRSKDDNWVTYEMNSSHSVMTEHPQELVEVFLKIEGF